MIGTLGVRSTIDNVISLSPKGYLSQEIEDLIDDLMEHVSKNLPKGSKFVKDLIEDIDVMCKPHEDEGAQDCFEDSDERVSTLLQ